MADEQAALQEAETQQVEACAVCDRQNPAALLDCHRADCPYLLPPVQHRYPLMGCSWLVTAVLVVIAVVPWVLLLWTTTPIDCAPNECSSMGAAMIILLLCGVPILAPSMLAVMFGVWGVHNLVGWWVVRFNPVTGATSRRAVLGGLTIRRLTVRPLDDWATFDVGPLSSGDYPSSALLYTTLVTHSRGGRMREQVARVFVGTLVSLAAQNYLVVRHAKGRRRRLGRAYKEYLILPGPALPESGLPPGIAPDTLEAHILHRVRHWPEGLLRDARPTVYGPTVFVLYYLMLLGDSEMIRPLQALLKGKDKQGALPSVDVSADTSAAISAEVRAWYDRLVKQHRAVLKVLDYRARQALATYSVTIEMDRQPPRLEYPPHG